VLKENVALTMSVTRRMLERRWGTGRDGVGPAGVGDLDGDHKADIV
jgi:hypothetical protein